MLGERGEHPRDSPPRDAFTRLRHQGVRQARRGRRPDGACPGAARPRRAGSGRVGVGPDAETTQGASYRITPVRGPALGTITDLTLGGNTVTVFTCPKCGELYNAGVSLAKRHACRQRQAAATRQTTAEWRESLGWREGQGFSGARPRPRQERRDPRVAAAVGILSGLGAVVSILSGRRVRRTDWVKAARQPRAGGFGAGGDGGSAGD